MRPVPKLDEPWAKRSRPIYVLSSALPCFSRHLLGVRLSVPAVSFPCSLRIKRGARVELAASGNYEIPLHTQPLACAPQYCSELTFENKLELTVNQRLCGWWLEASAMLPRFKPGPSFLLRCHPSRPFLPIITFHLIPGVLWRLTATSSTPRASCESINPCVVR